MVLGPSEDGGYYLIGLRGPQRELFVDMPWSTSRVVPETLRRSVRKGLRVACLEPWFDVDHPEDLARLQASLETDATGRAPHTREFLRFYRP